MRVLGILAVTVCGLFSTGCATIITGGGHTQNARFTSYPPGAEVYVDNNRIGKTPIAAQLTRHDDHVVRIELAGYPPQTKTLKSGPNLWTFGNLIFGGIIGIIVDAASGSWEGVLNPNDVNVKFSGPPDTTKYPPPYQPYTYSDPSYRQPSSSR
jgi:hypothetical protein